MALACAWAATGVLAADPAAVKRVVPDNIEFLLEEYCWDCHEDGTTKGDVRLDNLDELDLEAWLELLNRMQEQVYFKQMPPPDNKWQPSNEEQQELGSWIAGELHVHKASKLEEKLRYPAYGNAVDHDKLFSGEIRDAAFTPARRWLVSPQIFGERVADIFELEGRARSMKLHGVSNPFLLPDGSGVRYYDNGVLDGGHLLVMLGNADWISKKQIRPARV